MNPLQEKAEMIFGPPGTGKTRELEGVVSDLLQQGVNPNHIAFLSFTQKGAYEGRGRIMDRHKLKKEQLPYFRTFHSLAFHYQNLEPRQVMGWGNYLDICKMLGLTITSQRFVMEEGTFNTVHTKGDRLFFMDNYARTTKKSLEFVHQKFINDDIDFRELKLLSETLRRYKEVQNKIDFTDMIVNFCYLDSTPPLKALIIDEAQDLSPIQWDMAQILARKTPKVWIAGDDDQAIYNWAGADVKYFLGIGGLSSKVLEQSYRLPRRVHQLAESVIKRAHIRKPKFYRSTPDEGSLQYHMDCETIDMSKGTWLLLARNIFLLPEYVNYCTRMGYLFESRYGSPANAEQMEAIRFWEKLRAGDAVTADKVKIVYKYMATSSRIKWGSKKLLDAIPDTTPLTIDELQKNFGLGYTDVWFKALNHIPPGDVNYYRAALSKGERMDLEPRIHINTIHSVKGGEADNVVLMSDMSKRTLVESHENPDDEIRVWYVAITRAKKSLHVIHPRTDTYFDL